MIKIATWNVNSVRSRIGHLTELLRTEDAPDILLLQELKCQDDVFPYMEIEDAGYNVAVHGQKTYNGVAVLSKHPIDETIKNLPGFELPSPDAIESRYIECVISLPDKAIRVASVYVPNGQEANSEKFKYKLAFFEHLRTHMETLLEYNEITVIGGDYNVAPANIDVYDPQSLDNTTCFHPEERKRFRGILNLGFSDIYRDFHPKKQRFSWWDYRGGSWQQNKGMRIDHLLLSPQATDIALSSGVDPTPREKTKPSDHTPVWCTLK